MDMRDLAPLSAMSRRNAGKRAEGGSGFQAGPGMVVTLTYKLFDAEGELVESNQGEAQLPLLLGYGQAAPSLETALAGAQPGASRRIQLKASEAFGERDASAILELARDEFPADVQVGDEFEAEDAQGEPVALKIVDVDAERVVADRNHPLAGQQISLELLVGSVRPATGEELERSAARLEARGAAAAPALLPASSLLRHLQGAANGGRKPGPGAPSGGRRQRSQRGKPT
jgi:FKBP-type peptidyl-prolyl cis-trans isomerase 2